MRFGGYGSPVVATTGKGAVYETGGKGGDEVGEVFAELELEFGECFGDVCPDGG